MVVSAATAFYPVLLLWLVLKYRALPSGRMLSCCILALCCAVIFFCSNFAAKTDPWAHTAPVVSARGVRPALATGTTMKGSPGPVVISGGTNRVPCAVPCFWPNLSPSVITQVKIDHTNISVTMSMESEAYYPQLQLRHRSPTHWIASTRFNSDIPMPYFSWAEYNIQAAPPSFYKVKKEALFVARNCRSRSKREAIVRQLMRYTKVASASRCLRNTPWNGGDKSAMMRLYGLYLAFENSIVEDYITEKLWGAYAAGTIPVYYGAPNVRDHIPPDSAVFVSDFSSVKELAAHLNAILANKTLFDFYHQWRRHPLPSFFTSKYNLTHTHSACRLCIKASQYLERNN